jgi:hypothetical protein
MKISKYYFLPLSICEGVQSEYAFRVCVQGCATHTEYSMCGRQTAAAFNVEGMRNAMAAL